MLRIYNYMVLGLAITGLAALGIYMLSVTDRSGAAKVCRGAEVLRDRGCMSDRRSARRCSSAR